MSLLRQILVAACAMALVVVVVSQDVLENEISACPRHDDPKSNATILAHPTNCSAFFICSNGKAYEFGCPSILKFNDELKVCDWPDNVDCEDGSGSGDDTVL